MFPQLTWLSVAKSKKCLSIKEFLYRQRHIRTRIDVGFANVSTDDLALGSRFKEMPKHLLLCVQARKDT